MTTPECPNCRVELRQGECPRCWTRWPDLVEGVSLPEEERPTESSAEEDVPCPQCGRPLESSALIECNCLTTDAVICLCNQSVAIRERGWSTVSKYG